MFIRGDADLKTLDYPHTDIHRRFISDKYVLNIDEDNNFIQNEKEQHWIEYIKVIYHENDIPISQIARGLNTRGVPTKRGDTWSHKQVSRIFAREK